MEAIQLSFHLPQIVRVKKTVLPTSLRDIEETLPSGETKIIDKVFEGHTFKSSRRDELLANWD